MQIVDTGFGRMYLEEVVGHPERMVVLRTERLLMQDDETELNEFAAWFHGLEAVRVEGKRVVLLIRRSELDRWTAVDDPIERLVVSFLAAV